MEVEPALRQYKLESKLNGDGFVFLLLFLHNINVEILYLYLYLYLYFGMKTTTGKLYYTQIVKILNVFFL